MSEISNYDEYKTPGLEQPKQIVILLHGVGSNGQDLISLAPYWAKDLPEAIFVSPDAPFVCDMVPPGYPNAYQWFSLQNRDPHVMLQEIKVAKPLLDNFINETCRKYNLSTDKTVLVGFSQGTMMSLYTAPRFPKKLAGVLGYSGALLGEAELEENTVSKMPIHLVHGEADDVVPVGAHAHATAELKTLGFEVSGHTTPGLPHSIDEQGIQSGAAFLKSILT